MKLLIVEDEVHNTETLLRFVNEIKGISDIETAETIDELKEKLLIFAPDLILLDIYLKQNNSMNFLQDFIQKNPSYILPQIIITTGFDNIEYYKQANQIHSIDYLLKPIQQPEFKNAVKRAMDIYNGKLSKSEQHDKSKILIQNYRRLHVVTALDEHLYLDPSRIIYCQAYTNYSEIYLEDGNLIVTKMSIGVMERILEKHGFFRITRSYLLNPEAIKTVSKKRLTIEFYTENVKKLKLSPEKIREAIDHLNQNYPD